MVFESDKVVLYKNRMYVGKRYVSDGLFKLNVKPNNNKAISFAYFLEFSNLWHDRLGYVNYNALHKLINMNHMPTFRIGTKHKCDFSIETK